MSDNSCDHRLELAEHDSRVKLASHRENLADDDCIAFRLRDRAYHPAASASSAGDAP